MLIGDMLESYPLPTDAFDCQEADCANAILHTFRKLHTAHFQMDTQLNMMNYIFFNVGVSGYFKQSFHISDIITRHFKSLSS